MWPFKKKVKEPIVMELPDLAPPGSVPNRLNKIWEKVFESPGPFCYGMDMDQFLSKYAELNMHFLEKLDERSRDKE